MILLNESVLKNCEVTEQPRERERERVKGNQRKRGNLNKGVGHL
jgi:hypothetical protein